MSLRTYIRLRVYAAVDETGRFMGVVLPEEHSFDGRPVLLRVSDLATDAENPGAFLEYFPDADDDSTGGVSAGRYGYIKWQDGRPQDEGRNGADEIDVLGAVASRVVSSVDSFWDKETRENTLNALDLANDAIWTRMMDLGLTNMKALEPDEQV